MNHRQTANAMIRTDLKDAGFEVAENMNGGTRVELWNRPISTLEVVTALRNAGYDRCQFRTSRIQDYVIIEAIV